MQQSLKKRKVASFEEIIKWHLATQHWHIIYSENDQYVGWQKSSLLGNKVVYFEKKLFTLAVVIR
jgi:hypothetical protein